MVMKQQSLYYDVSVEPQVITPVNVASIPQRSPFRYPGGKTWFVPTLRNWLTEIDIRPDILVEPFAGGGIITLTSLFENFVGKAVMVELDDEIAAVWKTITSGQAKWLAKRILDFDLTKESLIQEISKPASNVKEKAFQTILKNRTYHGGILAEGSGFLKNGENGKGILSRWYPETLARRFTDLALIADRIEFRQEDGLEAIKEFSSQKNAVFFIDPPYTAGGKKAGKRLYRHCTLDHELLFELCKNIKGDFLLTYDNAEEVKVMARKHGFQMRLIPMKNTHHALMEELVIGKDLTWMDKYPQVHEPVGGEYETKKGKKSKRGIKRLTGEEEKGKIRGERISKCQT